MGTNKTMVRATLGSLLLFVLIISVFSTGNVWGQEGTPPPTATFTPPAPPVDTATSSPTSTATETATVTATPLATDTTVPSETPTATPTDTPTFTATDTPRCGAPLAGTNRYEIAAGDSACLVEALEAVNPSSAAQCETQMAEIYLAPGSVYTFTSANNPRNALPKITCNVILYGQGSSLQRAATASENFRFFEVNPGGSLTLDRLTLQGGYLPASNQANIGGAVMVNHGSLTIRNGSILRNNTAYQGSAIHTDNAANAVNVHNSCFLGNTTTGQGYTLQAQGMVDATNNWWDNINGPATSTTLAEQSVSPDVVYAPFQTVSPSCDPVPNATATENIAATDISTATNTSTSTATLLPSDTATETVIAMVTITSTVTQTPTAMPSPTKADNATSESSNASDPIVQSSELGGVCDYDIANGDISGFIAAINSANNLSDTNTICLAQDGSYPFSSIDNNENALPRIVTPIIVEGNNATLERLITAPDFRFFQIMNNGTLTLINLTMIEGISSNGGAISNDGFLSINNGTFSNNYSFAGGAIDNSSGNTSIINSMFNGNQASYGGAIDNDDPAVLTIANTTFTDNEATDAGGVIDNDGSLTIYDSSFTTNSAGTYGGVIDNDASLTISNSQFSGNEAGQRGGAIYNLGSASIVGGSAFYDNHSIVGNGWGGAIFSGSSGSLTLNNVTLIDNDATSGGAIRSHGNLTIEDSLFTSNAAPSSGGAIYFTGPDLTITDSEFLSNTTTGDGGALRIASSSSVVVIEGSTFNMNSGVRGGLALNGGTLTITSSQITNNTATNQGGAIYSSSASTLTIHQSCIVNNTATSIYYSGSTDQNLTSNWWGSASGPSGSASGSGDSISSHILYTPFVTTGCFAVPTATPTSTFTATSTPTSTYTATSTPNLPATNTPTATSTPTDTATSTDTTPTATDMSTQVPCNAGVQGVYEIDDGRTDCLVAALAETNPTDTAQCSATPIEIYLATDGLYVFTEYNNYLGQAYNALPVIYCAITIHGQGATLDQNGATSFRYFYVLSPYGSGITTSLTLENITLQNGSTAVGSHTTGTTPKVVVNITDSALSGQDKTTIVVSMSNLNISNTEFLSGLFGINSSNGSTVSITGSTFLNFSASVISTMKTDLQIDHSTFASNIGTVIDTSSDSSVIISDSTFDENGSNAIYPIVYAGRLCVGSYESITIERSSFTSNQRYGQYLPSSSLILATCVNLRIIDTTIDTNTQYFVSGVRIGVRTTAYLSGVTFSNNQTVSDDNKASAIYVDDEDPVAYPVTITNSCFIGNILSDINGYTVYAERSIDATNNWWDSASGPTTSASLTEQSVSANVEYIPYKTVAPRCDDNPDTFVELHFQLDQDYGSGIQLGGSSVDIANDETSVQTAIIGDTAGPEALALWEDSNLRAHLLTITGIPENYADIVRVSLIQPGAAPLQSLVYTPTIIEEPDPTGTTYILANGPNVSGLPLALTQDVAPNENHFSANIEVSLCLLPTQQGVEVTATPDGTSTPDPTATPIIEIPTELQGIPPCGVTDTVTLDFEWADDYGILSFDGSTTDLSINDTIELPNVPLIGNTTGALGITLDLTDSLKVKLNNVPDLETFGYSVMVQLEYTGLAIDPGFVQGFVTNTVVEPGAWYLLSDAANYEGYALPMPIVEPVDGNYVFGVKARLCKINSGMAQGVTPSSNTTNTPLAVMMVMLSGAIGALGFTVRKSGRTGLTVLWMVIALGLMLGAGGLVLSGGLGVAHADNTVFLPDCNQQTFPTNTPYPATATAFPTNTPPPTNTPTPTATFDPTICTAVVVETNPGRPQEAIDMIALADNNGLMLHAAPTLNAMRDYGFLTWGTPKIIQYELVFGDPNGTAPYQIWYGFNDATTASGISWFIGELRDGHNVQYSYLDRIEGACSVLNVPTQLAFPYDRIAAIEFGIAQSEANRASDPERFGQRRVSTYVNGFPFADFDYGDPDLPGTDSAMFTSETIWHGGMPMTNDLTTSDCLSTDTISGRGWRYCSDNNWTSYMWRAHEQVIGYYIDDATLPIGVHADPGGLSDTHTVSQNPAVLENAGEGRGLPGPEIIRGTHLEGYINLVSDEVLDEAGLYDSLVEDTANSGNLQNVQAGDYLFVNSGIDDNPETPATDFQPNHGFIVAGWGPIGMNTTKACGNYDLNTPYQIVDISNPPTSSGRVYLYKNIGEAAQYIHGNASQIEDLNLIPYVIDYSGSASNWVQPPTPRPFYCSRRNNGTYKAFGLYLDTTTDPVTVYYANWYIMHLPNLVVLESSQIYIEFNWTWSNLTAR